MSNKNPYPDAYHLPDHPYEFLRVLCGENRFGAITLTVGTGYCQGTGCRDTILRVLVAYYLD